MLPPLPLYPLKEPREPSGFHLNSNRGFPRKRSSSRRSFRLRNRTPSMQADPAGPRLSGTRGRYCKLSRATPSARFTPTCPLTSHHRVRRVLRAQKQKRGRAAFGGLGPLGVRRAPSRWPPA
jgi:hypothetical protein